MGIRMTWVALMLLLGICGMVHAGSDTLTVFAAASTTNAVTEIGDTFANRLRLKFLPSFASSSTLAKQIENGAPADIFLSANMAWMSYLEKEGLIEKETRVDLLSNRIVLIAPSDNPVEKIDIIPGFNLLNLIGNGHLSMGDPDHVPAGIYGQKALESLGIWNSIQNHVARSKDVRAALTLVEQGEAPIGLVYATDAAMTEKVKIIGTIPQSSHPPIIYPVAVIAGKRSPATDRFMALLRTPEARAVFEKFGFSIR